MPFSTSAEAPAPQARRPLRVGILLDSWQVAAWVDRVVRDVEESGIARVELVMLNGAAPGRRSFLPLRVWRRRRFLLYDLYSRLDRLLFPLRPDPFHRVSLAPRLGDRALLRVTPRQSKHGDSLVDDDVARIRSHDLDVALRFGFRILRGAALRIARYGVWSYHHDDNLAIRGGPPGFWEVMESHPTTGSVLQVLGERLDAGEVLYRSWSPTHRRSVHRNKGHVYWKSTAFVLRQLRAIAEAGAEGAVARGAAGAYLPYCGRLYRKPSNREFAPLLWRFGRRAGGEKLDEMLRPRYWRIEYSFADEVADVPEQELFRFAALEPPADRWWADPFPWSNEAGHWIFLEEYLLGERKGRISAVSIDRMGRATPPQPVLERPYHLSHPFLVRWKGELFLIPESAQNRTVEAYRCRSFPDEWELETELLCGARAVDATLLDAGNEWWMFVNAARDEATHCHDELHLYWAASPLGPWRPHRRNPVKSDARSSRPAGALFRHRGDLLRPAQDCSHRYGHSISIQRVLRLDRDELREEEVARIEPRWRSRLLATHTVNRCGRLTVVDAMSVR